jgi:hypothetical protein
MSLMVAQHNINLVLSLQVVCSPSESRRPYNTSPPRFRSLPQIIPLSSAHDGFAVHLSRSPVHAFECFGLLLYRHALHELVLRCPFPLVGLTPRPPAGSLSSPTPSYRWLYFSRIPPRCALLFSSHCALRGSGGQGRRRRGSRTSHLVLFDTAKERVHGGVSTIPVLIFLHVVFRVSVQIEA